MEEWPTKYILVPKTHLEVYQDCHWSILNLCVYDKCPSNLIKFLYHSHGNFIKIYYPLHPGKGEVDHHSLPYPI